MKKFNHLLNFKMNLTNEVPTSITGSQIKLLLSPITDEDLPTVSIVTPMYNRYNFIKLMIRNYQEIDYPRHLLEWIIIDDSQIVPKTRTEAQLYDDLKNFAGRRDVKL